MSAHESSQVAPADTVTQIRADLYLQLQKPKWEDHGKQLQRYLDDEIPHLSSEGNANPNLIPALLQLYGEEQTGIDPDFDNVILDAIDRMDGILKSPVAGQLLNTLLSSKDLKRCQHGILRLLRSNIDICFQTPAREFPSDTAALYNGLTDVQSLIVGDCNALALFGAHENSSTSLSLACKNGFKELAEYLTQVAPEARLLKGANGYIAWHIGANNGQISVLEMLFRELEKLNKTPENFATRHDKPTRHY